METRVTLPGQRQHSVGSPGDSTFPPQDLLYIFIFIHMQRLFQIEIANTKTTKN